jgi:D-alanyl-D-alanine carboxypeptidase/D-alanyl-D-alanine-endopeptidase (penicillin-binding protein 4)
MSNRHLAVIVVAVVSVLFVSASPTMAAPKEVADVSSSTPATPILSARRFPGALQAGTADPEITTSLEQYLNKVVGSTCVLVQQDGRTIFAHSPQDALAPASTMKLATALAALDVLGPDATFTTRFVSTKQPKNGVVDGDLYVVGGGDPLLTTSGYKTVFDDPDQFFEDFTALADTLKDAGVKEITGGIIGDDSRYDSVRWIPTWPTRYQVGGTVAPLSALLVNDGSTGYADTPNDATTNRKAGDSPLLFAQTLRTVLTTRGIKVGGGATTGRAPSDAKDLASFESVPVTKVLSEMITNSDNTTAEIVLKEIGLQAKGQGTTSAGTDAVKESLTRQGFDLNGLVMVDGSGLDTSDRMTCALDLALVAAVSKNGDLSAALPVGGRTGTLRKRMASTASTGRVRAKTGTLNGVNALAGFADTPQGNTLTFAFIHNGTDIRTTGVADGFTDRLMAYAKGPRINLLGPLPIK